MENKVESGSWIDKVLGSWLETGQVLLNDLSSIFDPELQKIGSETSSTLARLLLSTSLNPQLLKTFRDHSVQLLTTLEKSDFHEKHTADLPLKEGEMVALSEKKEATPLSSPERSAQTQQLRSIQKEQIGEPVANLASKKEGNLSYFIPQITQRMVEEVLHSIDLLSAASVGKNTDIQQFRMAFQKIKFTIDQLIKPIIGLLESAPLSVDPVPMSHHRVMQKSKEKDFYSSLDVVKPSIHLKIPSSLPSNISSEITSLKSHSFSMDSSSFEKKNEPFHSIQTAERTIPFSAPFTLPHPSSTTFLRKDKKKRKFPWEREEYTDEDEMKR